MRQTGCANASFTGPLPVADAAMRRKSRSCNYRQESPSNRWSFVTAATTLALSVSSVASFATAPLQPSSQRPISRGVDGCADVTDNISLRGLHVGSLSRTLPLHMALADSETLLREAIKARSKPVRQMERQSVSVAPVSPESVYGLAGLELDIDLDASGRVGTKMRRRSPGNVEAASLGNNAAGNRVNVLANSKTDSRKTRTETIVDTNSMSSFSGPIVEDQAKTSGPTKSARAFKPISSVASQKKRATTMKKPKSRSSTMPGFESRQATGRHQAFQDGIKLVEKRTGKDLGKIVNSKSSKSKRRKANSKAMYAASASVPDSLIQFTNEIHMESRITQHEEIELGTKTQEAIRLQELFDNLENKLDREPTDAEWCAAAGKINMESLRNAIEEGMEAKNQLVTANLRMVQGVVNLYIRNGLGSQYNAGDLMQEGTVALIRAAEKFEPSRGFRFSTYAMYWIRAAVKRSQILQSRVISVPQRLHETHKKIVTIETELTKELGRKPSKSELSKAAGVTEAQLERCIKAVDQRCYSLDAEIENTRNPSSGGVKKDTMYDLIDSSKVDDMEYKKLQRLFLREDLIETIRRYLTPHEVDLLLLRYGLMDERALPQGFSGPLTIAQVSRLVGLKPDKVRRMINSSLRQLKHLIAHEWEDFEAEMI